VTASVFPVATTWSYGIAAAAYLAFAVRVAVGSRANVRGHLLLAALSATAVWALSCLAIGVAPGRSSILASSVTDMLRFGTWFLFVWHLLQPTGGTSPAHSSRTILAFGIVIVALIGGVLLGESFTLWRVLGLGGPRIGFLLRLGLSVFGLILVEQLVRRVQPQMRWAIKPLAIALAGVFGLELVLFTDAMLFGQLDADIWVSRGFANALVIPFLAMATMRNTGWTVDLHLSRQAVFNSSALLVSGAFLLAVAVAGYYVRYLGGDWGYALQVELLFAAALLVALVASSGRFRSKLKVFVSKHFFSYRYDYRDEWLRFTRTLSSETGVQGLQERSIMALANLVESPAGVLWMKDDVKGFVVAARWNASKIEVTEPSDGPLAQYLARTGWIVDVAELREHPERYQGLPLPAWLDSLTAPWLVVPLASAADLQGFVVLACPRTPVELDWEVRDLLKTASRQAASYLGQVRAAEALLEARKFDAFNRMSAFVVHDLKNLVSQLSLMLRNAERHGSNPAFHADMLQTVTHVVDRMNALMLQLRTGSVPVESARQVDLNTVLRRVCAAKADARAPVDLHVGDALLVVGHEDRLEHVIGHLVQNAIDATPPGQHVDISTETDGRFATVTVVDRGAGMSAEFVRERLFKPFQTTKPMGMGIGVYESQQYATSVGGDILVDSEPGTGTRVHFRLRSVEHVQAFPRRVDEERVA
jgi:putative PEP-CTERM system histidine kinase